MALQDFITHVKQIGMFVGNKFEFVAPLLDGTSPSSSNTVSLLCSASSLPGITLMTNDIRYFGEITERPSTIIYHSVNLTFYMDNDFTAKRYFEQWLGLVFNRTTRALNYYDDYTRDVEIIVYNKAEQEIERVKLFECYPKTVQDINLDYSNNQVSSITVTLIYKWWESTQSEIWKGNTKNETWPTDQFPTFGVDNLDIGNETLGNLTGNTMFGNGSPNFLGSIEGIEDQEGFIQRIGSDINSFGIRGMRLASDYMNFSNLPNELQNDFRVNYDHLSNGFSNLGSNISGINGVSSIVMPNLSNSINQMALQSTNLGYLVNQSGASHDFGMITGNMMQTSNGISGVSNINQLPQYLNSISSNFNQIGSMLNQSASTSSYNSATKKSFNSVAATYFSTGSALNSVATSIIR